MNNRTLCKSSCMKSLIIIFLMLGLLSCADGKDRSYTGSTPAGSEVRNFLGIDLNDSIDFIRWKLVINDVRYTLTCNYGISKPNTNGFINGGHTIELKGKVVRSNDIFQLDNNGRSIRIAELNEGLLHLIDNSNQLMVGNAGWSYALNAPGSSPTGKINLSNSVLQVNDSTEFLGRTPCGIPGFDAPGGKDCYKLKWKIVFFNNGKSIQYKTYGTAFRNNISTTGIVQLKKTGSGRTLYQLNNSEGKPMLHLLLLDEGVMIFTDEDGKLLVGDEDFSYTLNKRH